MKRQKTLIILLILSLFSILVYSQEPNLPVKVIRISDRVAVFRFGIGNLGPNVCVVATDKGLIVIDTHLSNTIAEKFKKEIVKEFGRDDFIYVINTHHHFDHAGGNQVFKNTKIIGHSNAIPAMQRFEAGLENFYEERVSAVNTWKQRAENFGLDTEEGKAWQEVVDYNNIFLKDIKKDYKVTQPQITFNDRMSLNIGEMTLKMIYLGQAHTESDIFIYIPEESIIFIGDTFISGSLSLPVYSGDPGIKRWIAAFETVFNEMPEIKTVVCGHSQMTGDELKVVYKYLKTLWNKVEIEFKAGSKTEAVLEKLSLDKEFNWITGIDLSSEGTKRVHDNNIRTFLNKFKESASGKLESLINEKGLQEALSQFDKDIRNSNNYYIDENEFNALGYKFLGERRMNEAVAVFKINTENFPDSWNVWDSLGEAYGYIGESELSMECYRKSLDLNPENEHAKGEISRMNGTLLDLENETRETSKYKEGQLTDLSGNYLGQNPPGIKGKIFAPGIVSTNGHFEFGITFSPDGKEMYFTRRKDNGGRNTIMVSRLTENGWTAPEIAPFSGEYFDFEPHITPDGKKLFYGTSKPLPGTTEQNRQAEIWVMERSGDNWVNHQHLGKGMYITSSNDRNVFMFVFGDNGMGLGKTEIINGEFGKIEIIDGEINSPAAGIHATVDPDEKFIIFDSTRPGGQGGEGDFYICFRQADGTWGKAVNLGDTVNTPGVNICPSLSPDGKYLFYTANRDIYWVSTKVFENLKKE
ncbi:MBL fold metallo-hydrolase [candidate division KSB1 bacterium]